MAYQITIDSEDDFKWLFDTIKKLREASQANPTLYLEYTEIYDRLFKALENKVKINNEWVISSFKTASQKQEKVTKERKPREKNGTVTKVLPNYCPDHPKYQARRSITYDCETCWNAYDAHRNSGVPSRQRLDFYRNLKN